MGSLKTVLALFLAISFTPPGLSQDSTEVTDPIYKKQFYNAFSRNLKKKSRKKFAELAKGDSIWIPLSLYDARRSYAVISNYSNYPELPTFNLKDTVNYSGEVCMVFGTVKRKKKNRGLFSVQVLVKDVCGSNSIGGYSKSIEVGNIFEHHLFPFWFFVN